MNVKSWYSTQDMGKSTGIAGSPAASHLYAPIAMHSAGWRLAYFIGPVEWGVASC